MRLQGEDWQEWGNQLLTQHYGPTEYVRVPDQQKGDAGIEGFTLVEGHVYQAYGCEEPLTTAQRYGKQRDKMTRDIKKFIENDSVLAGLFGPTKITRWLLFVPYCDSKDLVDHANKKTEEVVAAKLSYVGDGFRVKVCDEDDFKTARAALLAQAESTIQLAVDDTTPEQIADWVQENDELVTNLDRKISKLPSLTTEAARHAFRDRVLRWYMEGQEMLTALRKYPATFERVVKAKSHRENYLASLAINAATPAAQFQSALDQLLATYGECVKEVSNLSAESLAHEAVADWLVRCPLDFAEGTNG